MQLRRLYIFPKKKSRVPKTHKIELHGRVSPVICGRKICYDRRGAAASIKEQKKRLGIRLSMYPHHCGFWHLTKQRKLKKKKPSYLPTEYGTKP